MLADWELVIRLLLAALLGSVIGFERERLLWAAGLRTHMLVCVGACLMMIVSAFGFADVLGGPHVILDPSRIAAQVVSGIGFLGAGSILLRGEVVRGLTTAASLWAVAGIGLAVGGGLYTAAMASTAIILVILAGIKPIEERYRQSRQTVELKIQARRGEMSADLLRKTLGERAARVRQLIIRDNPAAGCEDVTIVLARTSPEDAARIGEQLNGLSCVTDLTGAA
ncbi:MAG: MgtC/SapB family protein [Caulobacteraceae bacterium]